MHLWNDYEGKVIAEAYPLQKLLRPEGRSAFFMTEDRQGGTDVIRLTEAINDEEEMLERWRRVAEVHQVNLVTIKRFGQTMFDGVPLAYALMERTDGSLAEILKERPLTLNETVEVGTSVVAALGALHAKELIHEHVEPANVLAMGDVIKLRSDCVRECRADLELDPLVRCAELKQGDVHDLAMLLLRCLTLERRWKAGVKLPAPFDRIVAKGMDGSWGLSEIGEALRPVEAAVTEPGVAETGVPKPLVPESVLRDAGMMHGQARAAGAEAGLPVRRVEVRVEPAGFGGRSLRFWLVCAGAVMALLLLLWLFLPTQAGAPEGGSRGAEVRGAGPVSAGSVSAGPVSAGSVSAGRVSAGPVGAGPVSAAADEGRGVVSPPVAKAGAASRAGWRVVAFTYNHQAQAVGKVASIQRKHGGLEPGVYAPRGGGPPFLVTLGGSMTRAEAEALRDRARRAGMPRDTFARNY